VDRAGAARRQGTYERRPEDGLSDVFRLFGGDNVLIEQTLQPLIGSVNAQLLKRIVLKTLKSKN
jgi:hypothetical protein